MAVKKTTKVDPIIVLNDTYQVKLDSRCLILQKKASMDDKELSKEEQKEGMKILGYHSTWKHLGSSLIDDITRDKASKIGKEEKLTMKDFIGIVDEANKEVEKMFEKIDDLKKVKSK